MTHLGRGAGIEEAIALSERLAKFGWHLQVHFEASLIEELAPWLARSAVPVVIDHMGRVDASLGLDQPAFRRLLELMRDPRFRVKVSGSERISRKPAPWEDAIPFARKLVAEFGDRCFWGSDWPHPNLAAVPDDGVLVDLLSEIAPSEKERKALLVDNPRSFYRIDVLVNNVGGSAAGGPVEMSEETWNTQIDFNLKSVFLGCKHVIPVMEKQRGGAIVNIASTSGIRFTGNPQIGYAATKAAVIQFSRVVAVQYAARGIPVNTVVPGHLPTPIVQAP